MVYTMETVAHYYDCDESGKLRISELIRMMQQVATDHLDAIDLSFDRMVEGGVTFLLTDTFLQVHKMPVGGQKLLVKTVPNRTRGVRFYRDMVFYDADTEERLVSILTLWVLVEPESRRIVRPRDFPFEMPLGESLTQGYVEATRLPKVDENTLDDVMDVPMGYAFIDNNGHVNNGYYVDFACNMLPYDQVISRGIRQVVVKYENEALHDDVLTLRKYALSHEQYHFVGTKGEAPCFQALITLGDE